MRRAALLAACALVAGCGSSAPAKKPTPTPAKRAAHTSSAITYCGPDTPGTEAAATRTFTATQGKVKASFAVYEEQTTKDYDALRHAMAAGKCDVASFPSWEIATLAAAGELRDLTAYMHRRRDEFLPVTLLPGEYQRRSWAVPREFGVRVAVSRHSRAELGSGSWFRLYDQRGVATLDNELILLDAFTELATSTEGAILTPDGMTADLDTPANRAALNELRRAYGTYHLLPAGSVKRIPRGRAKLVVARSDDPTVSDVFGKHWWITPIPGAVATGEELVVAAHTRDPAGAMALIDHLTSAAQEDEDQGGGFTSPLHSSYQSNDNPVYYALQQAITLPVTPSFQALVEIVSPHLFEAVTGRESTGTALARAQHELNRALAAPVEGKSS